MLLQPWPPAELKCHAHLLRPAGILYICTSLCEYYMPGRYASPEEVLRVGGRLVGEQRMDPIREGYSQMPPCHSFQGSPLAVPTLGYT